MDYFIGVAIYFFDIENECFFISQEIYMIFGFIYLYINIPCVDVMC